MFIKWSSLHKSVSKFTPKKFYEIDPWFSQCKLKSELDLPEHGELNLSYRFQIDTKMLADQCQIKEKKRKTV